MMENDMNLLNIALGIAIGFTMAWVLLLEDDDDDCDY